MKLLRENYKTYDSARKRAGFENGVAPGEYHRGEKAHMYAYHVVQKDDGTWKVARTRVALTKPR